MRSRATGLIGRLPPLLLSGLLVLSLFLGGCDSGGGAGEDPKMPDPVSDPDWSLSLSQTRGLEPGEAVAFDIETDGAELQDVFIWVDAGTDREVYLPFLYPVRRDWREGTPTRQSIPVLYPGTYQVQVGTREAPQSNVVEIECVSPELVYSQEEMALLLEEAFGTIVRASWALLDHPDPQIASFRETAYNPEVWSDLEEWFDGMAEVAGIVGDEYRSLPPDLAEGIQSYYDHAGLLEILERVAGAGGIEKNRTLQKSIGHPHPVHAMLVTADLVSGSLHLMETVIGAAELVVLLIPAAGPATAGLGLAAELILRAVRGVLQVVVPSDLVAMEVQSQGRVYENQEITEWYWAEMRPQERPVDGIVGFAADAFLAGLKQDFKSALRPEELRTADIEQVIANAVSRIVGRLPFLPFIAFPESANKYLAEVKVVANQGFYDLDLDELLAIVAPVSGPLAPVVLSLEGVLFLNSISGIGTPPDVFDALSAEPVGTWTEWVPGSFAPNHEKDFVLFDKQNFVAPGSPAFLPIEIQAHPWTIVSWSIWFYDVPVIERRGPAAKHTIALHNWPTDDDPGRPFRGRHMIVPRIDFEEGNQEWIVKGPLAPDEDRGRPVAMQITDENSPCQQVDGKAEVRIAVNGEQILDWTELDSTPLEIESRFDFEPGRNTVLVDTYAGCAFTTSGHRVLVDVGFPHAVNRARLQYPRFEIRGGDRQEYSEEIVVWTPPTF